MDKDYTAICSCNRFERCSSFLSGLKLDCRKHIRETERDEVVHEIYINRNIDDEIDDSFNSILIK